MSQKKHHEKHISWCNLFPAHYKLTGLFPRAHLVNLSSTAKAADRLGPFLVSTGDVFAEILDLDNGWAYIISDDSLEVSFVWLGRAGVVRFRPTGPSPLLRFCTRRDSNCHGVLGLHGGPPVIDVSELDRGLLLLGLHIDRLLGSLGGARLARTKRSFGALAILLLFLYRRRLVRLVSAQSLEGVQQGLVNEAIVVEPFLAFFIRTSNQSLVRILGTVASAARFG